MARKDPHAVALGRRGGLANKGRTSEAKAAAARENGKKGGRPKKVTGCSGSAAPAGPDKRAGVRPRSLE